MSNITSIFQAVEFIEGHLTEEIAIAHVADAVSYSVYHFCRIFNQVTHHSPYDYLIRRRLSESALELIETDKKITDIAFDYQFNSPETYSRAFKRMFGLGPNHWKKQGDLDKRFLMSRITLEHLRHRNKRDYLKPTLEDRDAFQVAGVMTLVQDDQEVISQLWDILAQELEGLANEASQASKGLSKPYYGIVTYPKSWGDRGFLYMAAKEIESPDITSPVLMVKTIPALSYARFIHQGPYQDLKLTRDYIYQTWLPKSGKRLAYPIEIERRHFEGSDREESERVIYIPVE